MDDSLLFSRCPKCEAEMASGFLATEQKGGGVLTGGLKCSRIIWTEEFKMGFLGGPKGETVSTRNTHKKSRAVPAVRCTSCNFVAFEY